MASSRHRANISFLVRAADWSDHPRAILHSVLMKERLPTNADLIQLSKNTKSPGATPIHRATPSPYASLLPANFSAPFYGCCSKKRAFHLLPLRTSRKVQATISLKGQRDSLEVCRERMNICKTQEGTYLDRKPLLEATKAIR